MRKPWLWYVLGGAIALVALVAAGLFVFARGGSETTSNSSGCPPVEPSESAGNTQVSGRALGPGFKRTVVIRANDKDSGAPVRDAKVTIHAVMTCPHFMPLYDKDLREVSTGTYKGPYTFIMAGEWRVSVVVVSKENGTTTAGFPLRIGG